MDQLVSSDSKQPVRIKPVLQYGRPSLDAPASPSHSETSIWSGDQSVKPDQVCHDDQAGQSFCGGYGEWSHVVRRSERTIIHDLEKFALSDEIKNQADVIFNQMTYRVRRGKIRDQMLFYCVYCAHLELNQNVNPISLGAMFKLDQGDIQRCDSIFSPLQTGYRPPSSTISPLRYLPNFGQSMELSDESTTELTQLASTLLIKDPKLYQENPQTVAAGILRYYTLTNGIDDVNKIKSVTNRSIATIETMFDRIARIDNTPSA